MKKYKIQETNFLCVSHILSIKSVHQAKLQRDALEHADVTTSIGNLTNPNISDYITRFITKGRLQLLETNAVNSIYYLQTYERGCRLCGFKN